jgi:hypothetical protein
MDNTSDIDVLKNDDINDNKDIHEKINNLISRNDKDQLTSEFNKAEPKIESPKINMLNVINETSQANSSNSTKTNISPSNNLINTREKRIRKQKSFDDDFVLFNLSSSYYTNSSFSSN